MINLFQVGVGSGGMTVLDIVSRDPRLTHVTIVDADYYLRHNVLRHLFPIADVDARKATLAGQWLQDRRPDLEARIIVSRLEDDATKQVIEASIAECDIAICAADNEPTKYYFDALMRQHKKPWTLGEVLAGGIGGFVHWFIPHGPCYGCVASHLRRSVTIDTGKAPDYSAPAGPVAETTIPASRASISVIASLHAQITLQLLDHGATYDPGFTSMLHTLEKVPGVFEEAYRTHRFRIPRSPECLVCRDIPIAGEDLDRALNDALDRLKPL